MVIETTRFGNLKIREEQIIHFKKGVPGFSEATKYVMIDLEEYRPFLFMQSLDIAELMFVLIDPYQYFSGYPDIECIATEAEWPIDEKEHLLVRVIATISSASDITVNLIAPILMHTRMNIGEQVILQNVKGLTTRHSLIFQKSAIKEAKS